MMNRLVPLFVRLLPLSKSHFRIVPFLIGCIALLVVAFVFAHGCHFGGHDLDVEP